MYQSNVLINKVILNVPVEDFTVNENGRMDVRRHYVTEKLADWESTQVAILSLDDKIRDYSGSIWKAFIWGGISGGLITSALFLMIEAGK